MKTFLWNQYFETGLEAVDGQHHFLVDLINRFGEALVVSRSLDDAKLEPLFAQLADYAQYHFSTEEGLMLESGVVPRHREHHCQMHADFISQVSAMWNGRSTMENPSRVLQEFLCAWLAFHVLGEDQSMARQITLMREGKSAEEAFAIASAAPLDNRTAVLLDALKSLQSALFEQNQNQTLVNASLNERVKELRCLSTISELCASVNKSMQTILEDAVRLIPTGWSCPAITCARIVAGEQVYMTQNFRETPWHQHADIVSADAIVGRIDVGYLEERPACDEGPFLKEEKSLLEALSRLFSALMERNTAEAALRQQNEELERFNRATIGRELDMIHLKQQVNELSRQLGRAAPFNLAFADAPQAAGNEAQDSGPPAAGGPR